MTEQEQIEEMARKICIFTHHWKRYKTCKECFEANEYACQTYKNCKAFIEEGYRKLPENSVVLSREEYEKGIIERESMRNQITELFNDREQARRETAEKILNTIYDKLNTFEAVYEIDYESYVDDVLWEIAKQFGVE